ncbi:MAG: SDR family oxidoreductase [Dehalococcoidia bacterium]|nr:MAG: SDR family oxidoreductase [Dehalococcoidia bacterium]
MAVVLITGCSSGFGMLAAVEFARRGDAVYASMRDTLKSGPLLDEAKAAGASVRVIPLDVTDAASVKAAVADMMAREGRIDVLVNNAGVGMHGPVEEAEDDEAHALFETNVFGLLRVTRAVAPQMRAQGSGAIVNVSSLAGKVSSPFGGLYAATKHAVEALSDALYFELHPFGVRVSVVEPGDFETRFGDNRMMERRFNAASPYADLEQRFAERQTRLPGTEERGDARDVARVIVEAATAEQPQRRYLVGKDAEVIGGFHKQMTDEDFERAMRTALDFWE